MTDAQPSDPAFLNGGKGEDVPAPGQILTGKQEHCKSPATRFSLFPSLRSLISTPSQTSSASSSPVKSAKKYPSSTPPPHSSASAPPFDRNSARLRQSTQNCPSCAISSFTMFAISHSSIRRARRSSGRISFKSWVLHFGNGFRAFGGIADSSKSSSWNHLPISMSRRRKTGWRKQSVASWRENARNS